MSFNSRLYLCIFFSYFHFEVNILTETWKTIIKYVCRYVEVNMNSAALVWPLFNSLQAFWPGLQVILIICSTYCLLPYVIGCMHFTHFSQVLAGDVDPAIRTHTAFFSVWKRYGFTPEGFNLATLSVQVYDFQYINFVYCSSISYIEVLMLDC